MRIVVTNQSFTIYLPIFRSALTEGLLETAINEFQSFFVKEMVGFVVTNQIFDTYPPIFQVCTDLRLAGDCFNEFQ